MDLLPVLVAVVVVAGLGFVLLKRSGAPGKGAAPSLSTGAATKNPAASYHGRPLVDAILATRHRIPVDRVTYFTVEEVAKHSAPTDLWLIVDHKVYDVTDFVDEHPGGFDAIMKKPGQDNTAGFHGPQHPEKVDQLIGEYFIGEIRRSEQTEATASDTPVTGKTAAAAVGAESKSVSSPTASAKKRSRHA